MADAYDDERMYNLISDGYQATKSLDGVYLAIHNNPEIVLRALGGARVIGGVTFRQNGDSVRFWGMDPWVFPATTAKGSEGGAGRSDSGRVGDAHAKAEPAEQTAKPAPPSGCAHMPNRLDGKTCSRCGDAMPGDQGGSDG